MAIRVQSTIQTTSGSYVNVHSCIWHYFNFQASKEITCWECAYLYYYYYYYLDAWRKKHASDNGQMHRTHQQKNQKGREHSAVQSIMKGQHIHENEVWAFRMCEIGSRHRRMTGSCKHVHEHSGSKKEWENFWQNLGGRGGGDQMWYRFDHVPCHGGKRRIGVTGSFNLGTTWRWVINLTSLPLYPQGKNPR
jgi:hypothetical protein